MFFKRLATATAFLPLVAFSAGAEEAPCGERQMIADRLAEAYGEAPMAIGLAGDRLVELFVSPQTGSWTLLVTTADGIACLAASGEDFMAAGTGSFRVPGDPA